MTALKNSAASNQEANTNSIASQFLNTNRGKTRSNAIEVPSLTLPKGGGAVRGIDEKFSVNAVNGSAAFSFPLPFSNARELTPKLSLSYNSAAGNGIFGLGWNLAFSSIKRKSDKQLPEYLDAIDSDVFLFSEAEDLVPEYKKDVNGVLLVDMNGDYTIDEKDSPDNLFTIRCYKPRVEAAFARIERWSAKDQSEIKWRVITRENITTLFGWSPQSRIAHPQHPEKIYEWLPEFIFDDKGNCCRYLYKPEDAAGVDASMVHNRNRFTNGNITYTNLYPHKILYGNKTPYKKSGDAFPAEANFLFETVFDYGTLPPNTPPDTINNNNWDLRTDAFSTYKPGFEIRTTRLCKRILFFHHFTGANEYDGLVRSLHFDYNNGGEEDFTFLQSITQTGYIKKTDGSYARKQLPAMEFGYQPHEWNRTIQTASPETMVHAPAGIEEAPYQFVDLFNEGLAGILSEHPGGWYYKPNLGARFKETDNTTQLTFEQAKQVSPKPVFSGLGSTLQLTDLDADGKKQLVSYNEGTSGYFELDDDNEWQPFKAFPTRPTIDFNDPFMRMIDLNGDGKPDLLVSEDNTFSWYENKGRSGFAAARKTLKPFDEETAPAIVFVDEKQTIFLGDMSGDGLTDLVRIRNGEICYWPNLGYGQFGSKVTMDNAPLFDSQESFNPNYLRMADIDGSGTTDIIYLGKNKFSCWKNLSGNRFSTTPFEIPAFPEVHASVKVSVVDLLGNGVACIVWSSPLAQHAGAPLQYIDLMNSKKPHIMTRYANNMGKVVSLEYTPSTQFYIDDKLAGRPWVTKLHFPVHCVSKTITEDKITGHTFIVAYKYHHGYYDHAEKEFRGFGMVEQTDAESFEHWKRSGASNITDAALHQEPVITKQWFHTGAFLQNDTILDQFAHEYWYEEIARQGFPVTHMEKPLPDARIIPANGIPQSVIDEFTAEEYQQAVRTCKGTLLRSEVFAHDAVKFANTPAAQKKELTPYTVSAHNCVIELLQPKGKNKHAVFIVKASEAISYQYEREAADPRIAHTLNTRFDELGNILESASVSYPRRIVDGSLPAETQAAQNQLLVLYTVNKYTNDVLANDTHRLRLPAETMTYQLKGVSKPADYYSIQHFDNILTNARSDEAFYHELNKPPAAGKAQRRLIEHLKTLYYKNDCSGSLPLYSLDSRALVFENYQLGYTPELLTDIFGTKVNDPLMVLGKYTHSRDENDADDATWWVRSGRLQYITGAETVTDAQNRFFMPVVYQEPFGAITKLTYYGGYFLLVEEIEDALLNKVSALSFNFRTLAPRRLRDANDNISETLTDELGFVKAMAVFGKGNQADDLLTQQEETSTAENTLIQQFFNPPVTAETVTDSAALLNTARQLLQNATTRFVYDLNAFTASGKPVVVAAILRETHTRNENGALNAPAKLQLYFEYSSGMGNVAMKKTQAAPGLAKRVQVLPNNSIIVSDVNTGLLLRWIGSGKTVLNNKGNAVKQYEPYFSINNQYEDQKELVEAGVTPLLYYDAPGRLVRTELADGTFSQMSFDSWKQIAADTNDTVTESEWYKKRTDNTRADFITDVKEQQAAAKAALHTGTPNQLHVDTLGRPVLFIQHNKNITTYADEFYYTRATIDIEGNLRSVTDDRGNTVMQYKYDMLGNIAHLLSMDAGERFLLQNVAGNPVRTWDGRNHEFSFEYDLLQRPTIKKVKGSDGLNPLEPALLDHVYEKIIYGEGLPNDKANNLRRQPAIAYDTAGKNESIQFDLNGNQRIIKRTFTRRYKEVVDWGAPDPDLQLDNTESFTTSFEFDALGRITKQVAADNPINSVFTPHYNETSLLNQVQVTQNGNTNWFVQQIDYNEKGQRKSITYGNQVNTKYTYDKQTFRLMQLTTTRQNNDPLQDLYYTYDPVGNITHIEDKNIPDVFFNNQKTTGISEYTYDALYRLAAATGKEHAGQLNYGGADNWNDLPFLKQYSANSNMAWRPYTQTYWYDSVGNMLQLQHTAGGGNYTRTCEYETGNNRLKKTTVGAGPNTFNYNYPHHAQHGFITGLPHLSLMHWNFKDELQAAATQQVVNGTPETSYYVYDGNGDRARKITERQAAPGVVNPAKRSQRLYVGGIEIYREYDNTDTKNLERLSYHVMDDSKRIAMIETLLMEDGNPVNEVLVRYRLAGHLGSASIETDGSVNASVISYEEYHPFGTTSYQAVDKDIKAAAKRYRYTGMERDEETGLEYHSARYYLPWLGRWLSSDPIGIEDGINVYAYCKNNPVKGIDTNGLENIVVVGSQHDNDSGNKLMFAEQGISQMRDYTSNESGEKSTMIIFREGYTKDQLAAIEKEVTDMGGNFVIADSADDLFTYVNTGMPSSYAGTGTRTTDKVSNLDFFSHGIVGNIELGYKTSKEAAYQLNAGNVTKFDKAAFGADNSPGRPDNITSYACRTALGTYNYDNTNYTQFEVSMGWQKPTYSYDFKVKQSLAQHLANATGVNVVGFYVKTEYGGTLGWKSDRRYNCSWYSVGPYGCGYSPALTASMSRRVKIDGATFDSQGAMHSVVKGDMPTGLGNMSGAVLVSPSSAGVSPSSIWTKTW